jgi:hypothetical protein
MFAITIAIVFYAAMASPQTPSQPPSQKHGSFPHAAPASDVTARLASLDARIAVLRADMMMFVGELKIQAMASLLDALVERQTLTDQEMRRMHRQMMERMMTPRAEPRPPEPPDEESPEAMCSPFI